MDKIVKNDGKGLVEALGLDEGTLEHQGNYCFMAAKGDSTVDIYTEPTDEEGENIKIIGVYIDGEEYEFCGWCGELKPIGDMRKEEQLGYLCDGCQRAIASRGEKLKYEN